MGKFIELAASDGHKLAAYVAEPGGHNAGKPRGGVVVIPEIFGVNSHIQQTTDGFAADGYLAVSPAMFDRVQRKYDTGYSQPEIQAGVAIMQKLDTSQSMLDVEAAIGEAKRGGKVGIVGYCYGGTVSWVAAARANGLACAVPYYGGGMPEGADLSRLRVPVMGSYGADEAARAEARVAEARGGNAARDTREAGPIPAREGLHLFDAGLPPVRSKRTIGERPLADRARAGEPGVDEERSEAERELLKALQSAR